MGLAETEEELADRASRFIMYANGRKSLTPNSPSALKGTG